MADEKLVIGKGGAKRVALTQAELDQRDADAVAAAEAKAADDAASAKVDEIKTSVDDWIAALKDHDLAQIESFVDGKINVDGVTDLASAKACMNRLATAHKVTLKILAVLVKRGTV